MGLSVKKEIPGVFALDQEWDVARLWVERLKNRVWGFKVGSILFSEQGPRAVDFLKSQGQRVFLDLKFHDIPNTVQQAVKGAFKMGVDWVTVHSAGGEEMLKAAASEQTSTQSVLAVSVLTSMDHAALEQVGVSGSLPVQVDRLSNLALRAGIKGLVSSVEDAKRLSAALKPSILLTPGVRLNRDTQDQKRIGTAADSLRNGATHFVIGRALYQNQDWEGAWEELKSSLVGLY